MDKQAGYVQAIQDIYPDLSIRSAHFHHNDGQYNDVLVINDELIFRFPRYSNGVESLLREKNILNRIQGWVTLDIPFPIYFSQDIYTVGKVFMGYRMLPGNPLWVETLHSLDGGTQQRLSTQLASFLQELHHIPVEQLGTNLPIQDGPEEWANLYAEIRQYLFPLMRPEACEWAANHFEGYFKTPSLQRYDPVLRHGDFGTSNILYDGFAQAISGIIDFGFTGIGDPAVDIAAISCYGESFRKRFPNTYPEISSMLERARFYKGTFALQEALYGFKKGDKDAFENGMAMYI